ncbi:MAG: sulfatase-like hydrolase/transferase [Planctomycetota bacterium]|nr:sulfatase-like hydrolase/transferase [Planctomycetota bacterium]
MLPPSLRACLLALPLLPACASTPVGGSAEARASERPNVVILFADDQRQDAIGAWADGVLKTPHLDRLAEQGLAFRRAYVAGSVHGAVCMPSRAMLHTGRHFEELPLGMTSSWSVPDEERGVCAYPTLFETFDAAGYETFATGKWHNGPRSLRRGLDGGDAIFFGGMSDHDQVPVHAFDPTGEYPRADRTVAAKFSSELFADAAIGFLAARAAAGADPEGTRAQADPFLLYVSFTAPHDPRMAPEPFASAHDPASIPVPPNFHPEHPYPIGDLRIRDEKLAPFPRTEAVVQEHVAGYWAMIEHLDAQVGRILEQLDAAGLAEDTIVVFASDNGLAVGQHGLFGKQNLYEHSAGVPLVLRGPGIEPGSSQALCYVHDLFPTLCDLVGIDTPDTVTARSLAPIIAGGADAVRDHLLLSYRTSARHNDDTSYLGAIVTPRWKYLRSLHERDAVTSDVTRLFDLENDPWEITDHATEEAQAARVATLAELLDAELAAVGDHIRPSQVGWNLARHTSE